MPFSAVEMDGILGEAISERVFKQSSIGGRILVELRGLLAVVLQ
jgi:hypothetical protein